jgi:hypothetical protein
MSFTKSSEETSVFVLSEELIRLLQWLAEHEQESLKKMIKHALDKGDLASQHIDAQHTSENTSEKVHENMINFLMLLDTLLNETIVEHAATQQVHRALIPALDTIDRSYHDDHSVARSIAKAADALSHTDQNPKEVLCKELLRHWHPHKPTVN